MIFLKSKGIVFFKKDVGEADRYIDIFMEDFGKITAFVPGIRKSKKRDKNAVDLLSFSEFSFYKKNENIILSNFSYIENYKNIRSDIEKINKALYIFSILKEILMEGIPNRELYSLVIKSLDFLNGSSEDTEDTLLLVYILFKVICIEGIKPETYEEIYKDYNKNFKEKDILREIFNNNFKKILVEKSYTQNSVERVLKVLQNYINYNLDTKIDIEKFLWRSLL